MMDEQYYEIKKIIPTFALCIPDPQPYCVNCMYFSQRYPDGYNGLRGLSHCSKYELFFDESADGLDSYKCDDHEFSEYYNCK